MTNKTYPQSIGAICLEVLGCDLAAAASRHEHLGGEVRGPWSDGPPAGYCHPQVEREELQETQANASVFAEQLRNAYKSLKHFLQRGT